MQNPWLKVQQIFYLFVVDLCETGFDEVTTFLLLYLTPELLDGSGDYTLSFILLVDLSHEDLVFAGHRVGLSRTGLSIGEDSGAEAFDGRVD